MRKTNALFCFIPRTVKKRITRSSHRRECIPCINSKHCISYDMKLFCIVCNSECSTRFKGQCVICRLSPIINVNYPFTLRRRLYIFLISTSGTDLLQENPPVPSSPSFEPPIPISTVYVLAPDIVFGPVL